MGWAYGATPLPNGPAPIGRNVSSTFRRKDVPAAVFLCGNLLLMLNWDFKSSTAIRNTILALVLASVALIVHNVFGQNGYLAARRQQKELRQLQQHILQLQQDNAQLEKQNQALRTDPEAIERKAREDMHLVKPGEKVYTLPNPAQGNPAPPADGQP